MFNSKFIKFKKDINLDYLSDNPNPLSVHFLEHNPNIINWTNISKYPNKGLNQLIERNLNRIKWNIFSQYGPIEIIEKNLNKVNWTYLSANPNAEKLLKNNLDKNIDWHLLSLNEGAIDIIEIVLSDDIYLLNSFKSNLNKPNIYWQQLSSNSAALGILKKNINKIDWSCFTIIEDPKAIKIIEDNITEINNHPYMEDCWYNLSRNKCAIHLLEKYPENINLYGLGMNPNAIFLIKKYIDEKLYVNYYDTYGFFVGIAMNKNPDIIPIILENLDKFNNEDALESLLENPNAISIIENILNNNIIGSFDTFDMKKIIKENQYKCLAANPNALHLLFNCDYDAIKKHFYGTFGKELVEKLYHPKNAHLWMND